MKLPDRNLLGSGSGREQQWPSRKHPWALVSLLAVVALVLVVRLRLLETPLERDEGEYAYLGQLMLDGVPPYQAEVYL